MLGREERRGDSSSTKAEWRMRTARDVGKVRHEVYGCIRGWGAWLVEAQSHCPHFVAHRLK